MNYEIIFDDITRTIRKDYAGAAEIKRPEDAHDFSNQLASAYKAKKLDNVFFLRIMNQYLGTLGDKNLKLELRESDDYKQTDRGLTVRLYEKELYVTSSCDDRIKPGDKLGKINAKSPKWYLEHMTKNILGSDTPERMDWTEFLNSSERVRVERPDGTQEFMDLEKFPLRAHSEAMEFSEPAEKTVLLRFDSFKKPEEVEAFIEEHKDALDACEKLIIDLRCNEGGFEDAFYPLLPYVIDRDMKLGEFMGEQGVYTNYTRINFRRRREQLKPYLNAEDEEYRKMALLLTEESREKEGSGYLLEKEELPQADEMLTAKGTKQVIILTDTYTEDAAETFVQQAKRMKKVQVVGRPTSGRIDYSNPVSVLYQDAFIFTYPISRSRDCQKGKGVKETGVAVDEYIAWTPEEITKDVILAKALEM